MYLINGTLSNSLPFRLHLPDGRTRTSLHELDETQLAGLGIYPCDEIKPDIEWTQHHGTPVIEVADGRATATYPVLDYSSDEVAGILEAARERKRSEIAAARFEAETAGIDGIKTDRESQALITGAALKAMQDSTYFCRWKGVGGFVELTAPQILAIADSVRSHVQSCFDREAELLPLIEAAESPEDLNEIVF
jgi:hypothetical protein